MVKRIKAGDIAIFPVEEDKVKYDEQGVYLPEKDDKVCFVQFITNDNEFKNDFLAVFDLLTTYEQSLTMDLEVIAKSKVLFLIASQKTFMGNGVWKYLGNALIDDKMPMQASYVSWIDSETNKMLHFAQDYRYSNIDPNAGHRKKIKGFLGKKLHSFGVSVTAGYVPLIAKVYYGLDFKKEYSIDPKRYMPLRQGVVWKIFPEFYKDTWR